MPPTIRVLLIEDDPGITDIIRAFLKNAPEPYDLTCASSMDEAIRQLTLNPPQVVLSDLNLPDTQGLDTLRELKDRLPAAVPLVILTGVHGADIGVQAMKLGAEDFLPKERLHRDLLLNSIRHSVERKKLEARQNILIQELAHSERIRMTGEALAQTAHELNTPLTSILGLIQLMESDQSVEDMKSDARMIGREAKRCLAIIQNLLAGVRRKKESLRQPVDLTELIQAAIKTKMYQFSADKIEVSTRIPADLPVTMADPVQIQQVMLNLFTNAVHAMEGSTRRRLSVDCIPRGDESIRIEISDTGPGIEPEILSRIFDPFYTTKDSSKGTGLGLSLCRTVITDHGGEIWAESRPNQGATLIIDLPVIPPPVIYSFDPESPEKKSATAREWRILMVDDDPACRMVFDRFFKKKGCAPLTAASVDEAIDLLNANGSVDLIVSDLRLPDKSGDVLYDHVRIHVPRLAGKFILMTGDHTHPALSRFQQPDSTVRILEKPFDFEFLNDMISEILLPPPPRGRLGKLKHLF